MVTIRVKVKPNSKKSSLVKLDDDSWQAQLKSQPVDGKANAELIDLVSDEFHCPKSAVVIKHGKSTRIKLVTININ